MHFLAPGKHFFFFFFYANNKSGDCIESDSTYLTVSNILFSVQLACSSSSDISVHAMCEQSSNVPIHV